MLTLELLLVGAAVLFLALFERAVRRLPLSPALIYLALGLAAGALFEVPGAAAIERHASALLVGIELAVLVSLFAVGLRLRVLVQPKAWRVALLLAGPGMLLTIALGALAAHWVLMLPWPMALLLAAVVAPTDPVLASDVQIRSEQDRDAVRLSLTAEGGLNDGSALPLVMLALAALGLHELGSGAPMTVDAAMRSPSAWVHWLTFDLLWPIGGGALLGVLMGLLVGAALKHRVMRNDALERDELIYGGATLLALGLAHATKTSSFVVAFVLGATLLRPLRLLPSQALAERLHAFGSRCERLVEAVSVLAIGVALNSVAIGWAEVLFGVAVALVVRPLAVLGVVRKPSMPPGQRRLVAWFGIRGVGSLYYLLFALEQGVRDTAADRLIAATLVCLAVSIVLHGVSATPLMTAYHARRGKAA